MKTIVFTGGGTAGHIIPGLAIIEQLQEQKQFKIYWVGNNTGIDKSIVESQDIQFIGIPSGKLRRYFSIYNFFDLFKIAAGFIYSFIILLKLKPNLLFSKGGFVSVPPCLAAALLRIPIISHECDYSPGLATKITGRFASEIYLTYSDTENFFPKNRQTFISITGNPVRQSFYNANPNNGIQFLGFESKKPILFFQGGSLGAQQINMLVFENLEFLCKKYNIVHQTGFAKQEFRAEYENITIKQSYRSFGFIKNEMPDILAASSLVISRAGANSVWECASLGKPMILIPLMKGSSRGDQIENASFFKKNGAAYVLIGEEVNSKNLLNLIEDFFTDSKKAQYMAKKSKGLAENKPAKIIAKKIIDFLKLTPKSNKENTHDSNVV